MPMVLQCPGGASLQVFVWSTMHRIGACRVPSSNVVVGINDLFQ